MLLAKPNKKNPPLLVIFYPLQVCFWKTIWACPCWSQCIGCWDVSRWPYLWDNTAWSHFANLCTELIMLLQDVAPVGTTLCLIFWLFWPVTFSSVPTSKSSLHRACWRAMVKGYNILSIICNLKRQIFITCQGQVLSEVRSTTLTIVQVYWNIMCHIVYKLSLKLHDVSWRRTEYTVRNLEFLWFFSEPHLLKKEKLRGATANLIIEHPFG